SKNKFPKGVFTLFSFSVILISVTTSSLISLSNKKSRSLTKRQRSEKTCFPGCASNKWYTSFHSVKPKSLKTSNKYALGLFFFLNSEILNLAWCSSGKSNACSKKSFTLSSTMACDSCKLFIVLWKLCNKLGFISFKMGITSCLNLLRKYFLEVLLASSRHDKRFSLA